MEFVVLGPLQVLTDQGPVEVTGAKERTVLARLVASRGRTVTVDDLTDTLWGETPPRSAGKSVQNYVLRLRKVLEPDRDGAPRLLVTDGQGYRLDAPPDAVDARRFERLVELGRRALREGRTESASTTLAEALALWRGPAYAGFESTTFGGRESRRLEELRLAALEDRHTADLDLGRARECVPELQSLVHAHPLRERLWELLVLALYRSGRQAEALAAYALARDRLVEELGVEPGDALRSLHGRVLAHDESLALTPLPRQRLPAALVPEPGELVGRERELQVLRAAWQRSVAGKPVTVMVRGADGSGARRLVSELAAEVADGGYPVRDDPAAAVGAPALRVLDTAGAAPEPDGPGMTVLLARPGTTPPPDAEVVDVGPLTGDDVAVILTSYVGEEAARQAAPDVLYRSGGLPGRVHDLAVQLARARTTARVGRAVVRAGDSRRALDDASAEVQAGVSELREVLDRTRRTDRETCPWKGLAAYDVADAPLFAGRERLVAELVAHVAAAPVLAVVGSSGSGKSSLLRAGLFAALQEGALPGSDTWPLLLMRPGTHPMRELVRIALRGAEPRQDRVADLLQQLVYGDGGDGRVVLVVDQLEEIWTACTDEGERTAFLDTLVDLASGQSGSAVVVALRSDYAGELAERPALARLLSGSTVFVGAPSEAELRRAIEHPAAQSGLTLDVGLGDALVADTGKEPGSLPLLSTALAELWEHRTGSRLTLAAYAAAGGVRGAVARLAERAYEGLGDESRAAARVLLLRLAGRGEGQAVTRRRVPLSELAALPDPHVRMVVDPLADARLLSVSAGHVEVAHEALFREWPRLRAWLEDDAARRAVQGRLAVAATEWADGGREPTELWRGTRLAAGAEFAAAHPEEVTAVEVEFLATGQAQLDAERRDAERRAAEATRQNRRLRWLLGGLGMLLVVALVAGFTAVRAGDRAGREALVAEVRELAAASRAATGADPELGVLLALEAVDRTRSRDGSVLPEAEEALHAAVTATRSVLTVTGIGGRVAWGDGVFVTEGPEESGLVDIRDARTGETVLEFPGHEVDVNQVRFRRDGEVLATTGDDGAMRLWDPATGDLLAELPGELPGEGIVWAPQVSDDGQTAAATWNVPERVVRVWDVATETVVRELPHEGVAWAVALSPDGRRLVTLPEDGSRPVVTDLATGEVLHQLDAHGWVEDLDWSPDGRWIAAATDNQTVRIWDAATGALTHTLSDHPARVVAADWSADSARLVTAAADGVARVWDLADGTPRRVLSLAANGTRQGLYDVAFSPDGSHVITGDEAVSTVNVFDVTLQGDAEVVNVPGNGPGAYNAAGFTPDGQVVAGSGEGSLTRWDPATGQATTRMPVSPEQQDGFPQCVLAVSPDGSLVAGADSGEVATVWDVETGEIAFTAAPGGWVFQVSWSPDSELLALSTEDRVVVVVDRQGREVRRLAPPPGMMVNDATFSPDGTTVAGVVMPYQRPDLAAWRVAFWDLADGEIVREVDAGTARRLAFSPGGELLVAGSTTGPARVIDVRAGSVLRTLEGHTSFVTDVAFSPDGEQIATSSGDGTVRLWDPSAGVSRITLRGHQGTVISVDYSHDGKRLVTAGTDDVVRVWALGVEDLLAIARERVTRPFTDGECRQHLHVDRCETGA